MSFKVVLCPTDRVNCLWPAAVPLLKGAIEYTDGRASEGRILDLLLGAHAQLWLMIDTDQSKIIAAGVSEIRTYTDRPTLHVMFVGGEAMSEWLDSFVNKLSLFGRHNQCKSIEIFGREGWVKVLGSHGFEKKPVVMLEKTL